MPPVLIFLLGLIVVLASWVVDDKYREIRVGLLVVGILLASSAVTYELSRLQFNEPK